MKRIILTLLVLTTAVIAYAGDFMPTTFYRYAVTKANQAHTLSAQASKVAVTSNVATFWSYTTTTGSGATNRFPIAANTTYVFDVPQGSTTKRMTFSGHSSAATLIYVTEQK